jgi:predicted NBD/HSP70 family sugar kinase
VPAVLGVDLGATNLRVALGESAPVRRGATAGGDGGVAPGGGRGAPGGGGGAPGGGGVAPGGGGAPGGVGAAPGGVIARAAEPVPATGDAFAARVAAIAQGLASGERIVAAGVGVPGIPDGDGFAGLIAGAAGLSGAPLRRLLEDALGVPVAIDNDVNLAALAESRARGVTDLAFIAVGTGVGMGIISGGRLIHGAHGAAGELGQLPVGDHVVAPFDELGPLEAIAGGAGLAARAGTATAHEVFDAGDPALLADQARVLADAIRAVQALLDPELIVLGGGIGCRADVAGRVHDALAAHGTPPPRVERSRLGEDAGLLGALALAAQSP